MMNDDTHNQCHCVITAEGTLPISAPNIKKTVLLECIDRSIGDDDFPICTLLARIPLEQQ